MYQLVTTAGPDKGRYWELSEAGLTVGRGAECDIVVPDPIVSRQHCRLAVTGNRVRLEDLGSRNPPFVNGVPEREALLKAGDEIALGQRRFLVVAAGSSGLDAKDSRKTQTWAWEQEEPASLGVGSVEPPLDPRPSTVQDLALLYNIGRELSTCDSMARLTDEIVRRLRARFRPLRVWMAFPQGAEDLRLYEGASVTAPRDGAPPLEAMKTALAEQRGLLSAERLPAETEGEGERRFVFTLVGPLVLAGTRLAVVALQTEVPHGAYDEEDLQFLVLLCQSVAPLMCAVQNLERLRRDNERLRLQTDETLELVGNSRGIRKVRNQAKRAAQAVLNVLITGETGTGKELVARLIHAQSERAARPFVTVNCAAIPAQLFESQLFGYEKGAFTGAERAFPGRMAEADGGTLFLDEVGDLSADNQARILRAIELGTFRRIGALEDTRVDIRVVAATNKDLAAALEHGAFRRDLYHRLNGIEIYIPPLAERRSDVSVLAEYFLEAHRLEAKRPLKAFSKEALAYLASRPWPGNVRELRNRVLRAIGEAQHDPIEVADVIDTAPPADGYRADTLQPLAEIERRHIEAVLRQCEGNVSAAARVLEIGRTTLYKRMSEYGIQE